MTTRAGIGLGAYATISIGANQLSGREVCEFLIDKLSAVGSVDTLADMLMEAAEDEDLGNELQSLAQELLER